MGPASGRDEPDRTAVQGGDPAGDGQAEPGPTGVFGAGAEPFEDPVGDRGVDAGALVDDVEVPPGRGRGRVWGGGDGDDPTGR